MDEKDLQISQLMEEKNRLLELLTKKEVEERASRVPANFVQISRASMRDIRSLSDRSSLALKVLMLLVEKMNRQNAIVISQKALCQLTGKSRQSIHKAISLLEKERWVKVLKVATANAYLINERVFWTSDTGKRKYALFSAMVVAAESEQKITAEEWDDIEAKQFPFLDTKNERVILGSDELPPPDQQDLELD